ncbi:MAG: hypothetical protein NDJ94_10195 [Vicinamibacteria bacterium]|nr:hypothetical protein [Vicinamibacteria bacterium]
MALAIGTDGQRAWTWAARLAELRQRRQPAEFRIEAPDWAPLLQSLSAAVAAAVTASAGSASAAALPAAPPAERFAFLAEAATGLWRLRQKMLEPGSDRPLENMRRPYRHLQSTWDVLAQAGLQVIDHTGAPFDEGLALRVLAFQPTPGLARETVIETVKPTLYFRDAPLQMGEVIVGTPAAAGPPGA